MTFADHQPRSRQPRWRDAEVRGGTEGRQRLRLGMPESSASFLAGLGIERCPLSPACPETCVWPLPLGA